MTVDVGGVLLEALVRAVERDRARVNTRRDGHVFIASVLWFGTYPVGAGDLARWIGTRRQGPRHDFMHERMKSTEEPEV